jgi:purine-binding chemotaxis protein CheW
MNETTERQLLELLIFELGGQRYGLPVSAVREIVRAVLPVPVPGASGAIEGVVNIRGCVVPVVDARRQFGLPGKPLEHTDHLVIAHVADRLVALRVDRCVELVRLPAADVDPFQGGFSGAENLTGIARLPDDLVLVHDLRAVLSLIGSAGEQP